MAVTPKISLVAFEARVGNFIFVAVPDERGRFLRTDKSVVTTACPVCFSAIGEPCKSGLGYHAQTHYMRRVKNWRIRGYKADDYLGEKAAAYEWRGLT